MTNLLRSKVLIFGASGTLGTALAQTFSAQNWTVIGVSRHQQQVQPDISRWIKWCCDEGEDCSSGLDQNSIDAVVWSQGINFNDSIRTVDLDVHASMYQVNVLSILESLQQLLAGDVLTSNARLCVISSIWQDMARENKLSYCITKSALRGLVRSLAADLGPEGKCINAVLPGALDTPMTRANLTADQISRLQDITPLRSMPQMDDLCQVVEFLSSQRNTGLTGQFITADRGFSYAKYI